MEKHLGIVVMGAVFVDIKGYPAAQYLPGGRNAGRVIQVHGGVSRNVAEDIANVELEPTFISVVDHSGISADVIEKLNRHRVNTEYIRRTEDGLGTWLALFDNNGDVAGSISKRPDLSEIRNILEEHGDEIFRNADSIIVEIDMDPQILKKVFSLAQTWNKEIYAVVSNMSIAMERRDLLKKTGCIVCNEQEAGILFSENYEGVRPEELKDILAQRIAQAQIPQMIVTLGSRGAVYARLDQEAGFCPAIETEVIDTTGAGDAFFAGVAIGLTYGKDLKEACQIGTRLAASVIATKENVCPRFLPEEFGLEVPRHSVRG
jgi:pseudouridine kinase